ncbi:MAG: hypothetical protein RMN25_12590, partial [Anaerolineae bacterium]|nr:hypothetical protein [Thermoflexales bacterium]MDW8408609.1 hypothetical protein [Anaerolineae bacterium]
MSKKKHVKPTRSGGKAASTSVPQPSAPPAPSRSVSGPLLYAGVAVLVVLVVFLGVLLMRSNISAPIVTTAPAVSATATLASAGADKTSASDEFSEPLASFAPLPLEISVQQAASMRAQGAFVLDVREPFEWEQIHIPDATLIPL